MPLKTWFGWEGAASAAFALVVSAGIWWSQARAIDDDAEKARFLKSEIAKLDRDIAEVSTLREEIIQLLARKQVAEMLQQDRLLSVQILEQLARQRPAGVQLTAVREQQGWLFIAGLASSERDVARLLKNLYASPVFGYAELVEMRAPRFSVRAALKGKRLPGARAAAPHFPSDVHPGDPK